MRPFIPSRPRATTRPLVTEDIFEVVEWSLRGSTDVLKRAP